MTIVCATCAALVDLQAARKAARRAGRDKLAESDGCTTCGVYRRRQRVREVQERMAVGLIEQRRVLVLRPATAAGGVDTWALAPPLAAAHARAALALLRARGYYNARGAKGRAAVR